MRKKCSSDREKLLKFEAEGGEFEKIMSSLKYGFCKKSDQLNTFATYLSSLLGVIAIAFSNHA